MADSRCSFSPDRFQIFGDLTHRKKLPIRHVCLEVCVPAAAAQLSSAVSDHGGVLQGLGNHPGFAATLGAAEPAAPVGGLGSEIEAEERRVLLRLQSPIHPDRLLPGGALAAQVQAAGVHLGRRHVRYDRGHHPGPAGHRLLPAGWGGAYLWPLHFFLRQHHLLPHGNVATRFCGDLQPHEPHGGTGKRSHAQDLQVVALGSIFQVSPCRQVVDKELFLAGFDLNEDSPTTASDLFNATLGLNSTSEVHTVELMGVQCGKACYAISVASALTFLAGVYQVLMAVFRLGFVSVFLSSPMLDGFATGASFTILTVQAKYLLGLKIPRHQGYGTVVITWINIFSNIHKTNLCDLITSAICISVLVAGKEIQERFKHRLKIPLPTELVVVAGATLASHYGELNRRYSSSVSGHIPTGFIPPQVPSFSLMPRVALDAIPLAVISFAFTVSLSEMFAKKNGYTVRPNQEMLAIGFCNIIPSFFHCFTTSAALAKTMVKDSTGCQTQVSSLISALVILFILLFFAPFFYDLQKCVLACIIIVSLRGALRKFKDVPSKWRSSRNDAIVWLVTMAATALVSVELGLLVGIVFSMICVVFKIQNPAVSLLGRADGTELYEDVEEYQNLTPPPGVQVFRFQAPLYYANKDVFLKSLYRAVGVEPFLELTRRKKSQKKKTANQEKVNGAKSNGEAAVSLQAELRFHTIVLDCSAVPFVDSSGLSTLKGLLKEYKDVDVSVLFCGCNASVIDAMKKAQVFGKNDKDMSSLLFYTVHAAVLHANASFTEAQSSLEDSQV